MLALRYNRPMTTPTDAHTIKKGKGVSPRRRAQFLAALEQHGIVRCACADAGVNPSTLYSVMRQGPDCKERVNEIRSQGLDALVDEARSRALGFSGKASDSLLMFLIKQADPSYRDNYVPPKRPSRDIVRLSDVYRGMFTDDIDWGARQPAPLALPEPPADDFNPLR